VTTISILPEPRTATETEYRAVAGGRQSVGKTPGQALDALTEQLGDRESGTLLVVQHMRPDRFFTAEQQKRLAELMTAWREARDRGAALPPGEQAELEALIDAELEASTRRAAAMVGNLRP
jgi:hypothetical protein